jgi:quinol monooxygenase YgiN
MIYVIATLELEPGTRSAFLAEFAKVVPLVRAETGCVEYTPAVDAETALPAQHRIGPDRVMVIEQWQSAETLAAHDVAPHMQAYRSRVKALVRSREIRMLTSA